MQDYLLYVINIEIVFKIVYRVSCTVTWRELSGTLINARQTWTGSYPGRHGLVHTQVDMGWFIYPGRHGLVHTHYPGRHGLVHTQVDMDWFVPS